MENCRVGLEVNDRDIESYHRVGNQGRTIFKFSHKKDCQQLMKVKNDLSKFNLTDTDLGTTKIYINQKLCPCYKILQSKWLHAMKQIYSCCISNGTPKVKLEKIDVLLQ